MKYCCFLIVLFWFSSSQGKKNPVLNVDADDAHIMYMGRVDRSNPKQVRFAWSGIAISASFEGKVCNLRMKDLAAGKDGYGNDYHNYFNVIIDGRAPFVLIGDPAKEIYKIDTLKEGKHRIEIHKRTEGFIGEVVFLGFQLEKGKKLVDLETAVRPLRIEFLGNSITCGYGNEGLNKDCKFSAATENNYEAYGPITARNLQAEYAIVAFSGKGIYMNYDKTTEEAMPDLYDRIFPFDPHTKWDFERWTPDIVVINLGTNDFAHANPDSAMWVDRYVNLIKFIKEKYMGVKIICCVGPMMSDSWPVGTNALSTIRRYLDAVVASFPGDKEIYRFNFKPHSANYGCDWHPGVKTHQRMAEGLTNFIKEEVGH